MSIFWGWIRIWIYLSDFSELIKRLYQRYYEHNISWFDQRGLYLAKSFSVYKNSDLGHIITNNPTSQKSCPKLQWFQNVHEISFLNRQFYQYNINIIYPLIGYSSDDGNKCRYQLLGTFYCNYKNETPIFIGLSAATNLRTFMPHP